MTYDWLVDVGKSHRELTCQDQNGVPELTAEGQASVFTCVHEKQRGCLDFDMGIAA